MALNVVDISIIAIYVVGLFVIALAVSVEKTGKGKNTEDYFLASKALPWWAIGASLVAANISAEQIIGQSGQGYVVGLAIAAYEWQAAIVLIVVAKFFLPIFLKRGIYTMPQFLDQRYGGGVKMMMSVYWLVLYTVVNLTTVLWLGGLAVASILGTTVFVAMAGLALFAVVYSIYGGLKAVALTDIIQLIILLVGGAAMAWIALDLVAEGDGALTGLRLLMADLPGHFEMILSPDHPAYGDLPGIWTLLGGLWVLHFSYWGFNQYIIQRALGAESLAEAQKGLAFAALLKLLVPIIVVLPGVAVVVLAQQGTIDGAALDPARCAVMDGVSVCGKPDRVYGELMAIAPHGLRGLVSAALIAAIASSLASMMNSIATIFTMDVYRPTVTDREERHYVLVGRTTAFLAMVIALLLAQPFIGEFESGFQTVQEYTGFIAPGIVAVFVLGFFWKRTNAAGAYAALVGSLALNVVLKLIAAGLPFVIRIWIVFVACVAVGVLASVVTSSSTKDRAVQLADVDFTTRPVFNIMAIIVTAILVGLYVVFW